MKNWYYTIRLEKDFELVQADPITHEKCEYYYEGMKTNKFNHSIEVYFKPKFGIYSQLSFCFEIVFPPNYPFIPPIVYSCHNFLHPNVKINDRKVITSFFQNWTPIHTFKSICENLINIFFEFDEKTIPNEDFNKSIANLMKFDCDLFKQITMIYYKNQREEALNLIQISFLKGGNRGTIIPNIYEQKIDTLNDFETLITKKRKFRKELKILDESLKKMKIE